jgi:hypothetical protein
MSMLGMYDDISVGDWQRDYLYKVSIQPPLLILPQLLALGDVDIFITDFKSPGSKQKVIKQDFAGQWANFAGPLDSPGTTEANFLIDENGKLMKFLEAWHTMSGSDENAAAFPKHQYIGTVSCTLYKMDKEEPVVTYTLFNAWLPEIGELNADKTKENLMQVKCSIAYDKRRVQFHT